MPPQGTASARADVGKSASRLLLCCRSALFPRCRGVVLWIFQGATKQGLTAALALPALPRFAPAPCLAVLAGMISPGNRIPALPLKSPIAGESPLLPWLLTFTPPGATHAAALALFGFQGAAPSRGAVRGRLPPLQLCLSYHRLSHTSKRYMKIGYPTHFPCFIPIKSLISY